jgi:RimJ/RimL family protein N-acetyltransferase
METLDSTPSFTVLGPGDEERLEAFLSQHADTSMFLRANIRAAGIHYQGQAYEAEYIAAITQNEIVGVAAHAWNEAIILQAPRDAARLAQKLAIHSKRKVKALIGPWSQVNAARASLGLADVPAGLDSCEDLFSLNLSRLEVPAELRSGRVTCRHSAPEDMELMVRWRVAYEIEANGQSDTSSLWDRSRSSVERLHADRQLWILLDGDRPVSMSAFNAYLPDCVQIGGVYTPEQLRGRKYGRSAVAGSLLEARDGGVERAILFTDIDNEPARRAYEALGFRIIGEYGLVMFDIPKIPLLGSQSRTCQM